jgi:uncharacterized protein DUF3551
MVDAFTRLQPFVFILSSKCQHALYSSRWPVPASVEPLIAFGGTAAFNAVLVLYRFRADLPSRRCVRKFLMRIPLYLIMAIGASLAAISAEAQTYDPRYPVCMHVYTGGLPGGGGDYYECSFTSLPQCRATASGRAASCDLNPYYAFNEPPPSRLRHKRVY